MATLAEQTKIAKNTRFATIARALADAARTGEPTRLLVQELAHLRRTEMELSDRQLAFAALARQIGDAASQGHNLDQLLHRLVALRDAELGPTPSPEPQRPPHLP